MSPPPPSAVSGSQCAHAYAVRRGWGRVCMCAVLATGGTPRVLRPRRCMEWSERLTPRDGWVRVAVEVRIWPSGLGVPKACGVGQRWPVMCSHAEYAWE